MERSTVTLRNDLAELGRVEERLRRIARDQGLAEVAVHDACLALDEVLTNVIWYAYPEGGEHWITVRMEADGHTLQLEVEDDGFPFDPLSVPEPDLDASPEDRRIGGLGMYFVRRVMTEVRYERRGERNVLTLVKRAAVPVQM